MIKNIIFDLGGVLLGWSPENIAGKFCYDEDDKKLLLDAVFGDWVDYDAGRIDQDEKVSRSLASLPERLHDLARDLLDSWVYYLPRLEETIALSERLRERGYKIFLLSNAPAYFSEKSGYYKFLSDFDGVIFSGDVKMEKPDRCIYDLAINRYGIKSTQSIFIDDREDNVAGANRAGLHAYVFDGDVKKLEAFIDETIKKNEE